MARIRYLKPDFFKDEDIKDLPYEARLFYQGLWIQADREGRGEDRPSRLKIEIMPYDDVDAEKIMQLLASLKRNAKRPFIIRYEVCGEKYYQIVNWAKHQKPHKTERVSEIPPPPKQHLTVKQPLSNESATNFSVGNGDGDGDGKENGDGRVYKQASPAVAVSLEVQIALEDVYSQGFNIYQLINKFKKEAGWRTSQRIPDDVLLSLCKQYRKDKGGIREPYPWFIKVLKMESEAYFANKNIQENEEFKNQGIGCLSDILRQIQTGSLVGAK